MAGVLKYLGHQPLKFCSQPKLPIYRYKPANGRLNTQRLHLAPTGQLVVENCFRDKYSGENIGDEPDGQGHRKALYRPFAEEEEEAARYHGGYVSVDNRPPGLVEPGIYRGDDALPGPQLFTNPFKNQDVRIHRHTYSQ